MATTAIWTGVILGAFSSVDLAHGRTQRAASGVVDVITASDIEATPSRLLNDLLQLRPDLVGSSGSTGAGGVSQIDLRGLGSARSGIYVDGGTFLRGGATLGSHGDPTYNGADSVEFLTMNVAGGTVFGGNSMGGVIAGQLNVTRFGERLENADRDRTAVDLDLGLLLHRSFGPSRDLNSTIRIHAGDTGSLNTGFLKPGVLENEVTAWLTETRFDWCLGGRALSSTGWEATTFYGTEGFLESSGDQYDTMKLYVGQEARYNFASGTTAFADVQYGLRNWDKKVDYDSTWIATSVGVRKGGDKWNMDASVGFQWSDYDDLNEKRETVTANLSYERLLTDQTHLILNANYGVQHYFLNEGGWDFADPKGLFVGTRLEHTVNDRAVLGLSFNMLDVNSEWSSADLHRGSIGLDGQFSLSDTLTINPSVSFVNQDDTPSNGDNFVIFGLGAIKSY